MNLLGGFVSHKQIPNFPVEEVDKVKWRCESGYGESDGVGDDEHTHSYFYE